mgnify:CR=1 FL=1
MIRTALITGVTGQDGSYLSEFLIRLEYNVIGLIRRSSTNTTERLVNVLKSPKFQLVEYDLNDALCINSIVNKYAESCDILEIYNLAAQSHVQTSFDQPWYTFQTNALAVYGWLESIKQSEFKNRIRFYQAGTSEMFGKVQEIPQTENTPFYPRSPYGVSKLAAYWACKNYRESYGLYICNGILFNHESERRGDFFVTRKIVKGITDNKKWPLHLGNLNAKRDWGHAEDYVYGMWLMLQKDKPSDYVLATGQTHSIREFIDEALRCLGIDYDWRGDSVWTGNKCILIGNYAEFMRPSEVDILVGNSTKACVELGWIPKISFRELVRRMVNEECRLSGAA